MSPSSTAGDHGAEPEVMASHDEATDEYVIADIAREPGSSTVLRSSRGVTASATFVRVSAPRLCVPDEGVGSNGATDGPVVRETSTVPEPSGGTGYRPPQTSVSSATTALVSVPPNVTQPSSVFAELAVAGPNVYSPVSVVSEGASTR